MKTKLILLSLILLYSCKEGLSQTKNINTNAKVTVMNPEINAKNYVAKMIEKVKHYDKEPLYYIRIGKANCLVEVLVNDRLVHYNYELSNFATPIVINEGIFASGTQKMTVRMYPIGDLMKQEYGEGQAMTNLTSLSAVDIRIITMDNKGEKKFKDEVEVITHTSPKDAKGHFIGKGKPFFEYSFDFQATVPYDIGLWRKGQDLKQFDKKLIEQKVIEFIKNVIPIYENQDENVLAQLFFNSKFLYHQTNYSNKKNIEDVWNSCRKNLSIENKKIYIEKNNKLQFYGAGKVVFLMNKSYDIVYRGSGALMIDYIDKDGDEAFSSPSISLYLPQGKKLEDGLRMIE